VKSRADAERIATRLGAAYWHSKLDKATKIKALQDFAQGKKKLDSTYMCLSSVMRIKWNNIRPKTFLPL
jgi:hypothetical protein